MEAPRRDRKRGPQGIATAGAGERGRGRSAKTPSEIPPRGGKDIPLRVYRGISQHHVLAIAAGIAFYALLSIFPAIAALVALYSLFADPGMIASHLSSLSNLLPGGALSVIGDQLTRVAAQGNATLSFAFISGLALSIWSANAGTKALFEALNIVYQETEKRGFFLLNAISLSFTLMGVVLVLLAMSAIISLPAMLASLGSASEMEWAFSIAKWPLLFILASLAISIIYRYGPSRDHAQWRWLSWGSVVAAAAWLALSLAFSWYADNFGRFNQTYGSLGAAVGFMTWIWLSSVVLLIGAELNAEVEHQTLADTTIGASPAHGAPRRRNG